MAADDTQGPTASYAHPHVVVQEDVFNRSRIGTVVVCALTSNLHQSSEPGNVLLEVGEESSEAERLADRVDREDMLG